MLPSDTSLGGAEDEIWDTSIAGLCGDWCPFCLTYTGYAIRMVKNVEENSDYGNLFAGECT